MVAAPPLLPSTTPSLPPTCPPPRSRRRPDRRRGRARRPLEDRARSGLPGAVAILRLWEDLAIGDPPVAVLWHLETARLLAVLLPVIDREPLFHVEEQASAEGYPLVAVYGEQGPQEAVGSTGTSRAGPRGSTCWKRSSARRGRSPPCSKLPDRAPRSRSAESAPGVPQRKSDRRPGRHRARPLPARPRGRWGACLRTQSRLSDARRSTGRKGPRTDANRRERGAKAAVTGR